jgi:thiamine-phosphate pyrophosphorylase
VGSVCTSGVASRRSTLKAMRERCLLYYITDRSQFRGDESVRRQRLLAKIAEAARAGVDYIQLREKDSSGRELEKLARETVDVIRGNSAVTRFLINSRTDVALAVAADGVHLRGEDVAPSEVRRAWQLAALQPRTTESFLIAASCHTPSDVSRAEAERCDFAVFAPVFAKSGAGASPPAGLSALREACEAKIPVLALGGVTIDNAASCLQAGAGGIAGIRLFQENKIEDVVRALRAL